MVQILEDVCFILLGYFLAIVFLSPLSFFI